MIKLFSLLVGVLGFLNLKAQDNLPLNYFRSPMDIPLYLSGNFGELRSNHFHSGLDIKTQGVEGQKIYAVADGFVSRIRISPFGYGNAIYIDHPNGYTSVYAHLQSYQGKIAEEIKKFQYKNKTWEMDYFPSDTLLKVKKGQVIALSGNTGSSAGPHLHFEIRETKSENAINPLLLGFDIKDDVFPDIRSVTIYPLSDSSVVNNINKPQHIRVVGGAGNQKLISSTLNFAYGPVGLGIDVIDQLTGVPNKNGVYEVKLFVNNEEIFYSKINQFSFDESRGLNALIDYENYLKTNQRIQRSFILENNPLSIYKNKKNKGVFFVDYNKIYDIKYEVYDVHQNKTTLTFQLAGIKTKITPVTKKTVKSDTLFNCLDSNFYENKFVQLAIPKNALYENLPFQFAVLDTMYGAITPTYQLHKENVPLHYPITVAIKVGRLSENLRQKAVVVNIDGSKRYYSKGGEWRNNYLIATSKTFGGFAVMLDTIPPKIAPISISPNKVMPNQNAIQFSIADNLSGIKTYNGYIDNKWVLMEFDGKTAKLTYYFDGVAKGNHTFKLEVADGVGNIQTTEIPFVR